MVVNYFLLYLIYIKQTNMNTNEFNKVLKGISLEVDLEWDGGFGIAKLYDNEIISNGVLMVFSATVTQTRKTCLGNYYTQDEYNESDVDIDFTDFYVYNLNYEGIDITDEQIEELKNQIAKTINTY